MPITVRHSPPAASTALPAYLAGQGEFEKERDKFRFAVDQHMQELAERQRQFNLSQQFQQEQLGERRREFDIGTRQQDVSERRRLAMHEQDQMMRAAMVQQQMQQEAAQQQQYLQQRQQEAMARIQQQRATDAQDMMLQRQRLLMQQYLGVVNAVQRSLKDMTPAQAAEVWDEVNREWGPVFGEVPNIPAPEAPPEPEMPPPITYTTTGGETLEYPFAMNADGEPFLPLKPTEDPKFLADQEIRKHENALEIKEKEQAAAMDKATLDMQKKAEDKRASELLRLEAAKEKYLKEINSVELAARKEAEAAWKEYRDDRTTLDNIGAESKEKFIEGRAKDLLGAQSSYYDSLKSSLRVTESKIRALSSEQPKAGEGTAEFHKVFPKDPQAEKAAKIGSEMKTSVAPKREDVVAIKAKDGNAKKMIEETAKKNPDWSPESGTVPPITNINAPQAYPGEQRTFKLNDAEVAERIAMGSQVWRARFGNLGIFDEEMEKWKTYLETSVYCDTMEQAKQVPVGVWFVIWDEESCSYKRSRWTRKGTK